MKGGTMYVPVWLIVSVVAVALVAVAWVRLVNPMRDALAEARTLMEAAPRHVKSLEAASRSAARASVATSSLPVVECNESGHALFANAAFAATTGLAPGSCEGSGWTAALDPALRADVLAEWRHAMERRPADVFESAARLVDRDGRAEPVLMQCVPIGERWLVTFKGGVR